MTAELTDGDATLIEGAEWHLYVVEFLDHGVKVGVTARPNKRIAQHRRDAAAYGREVGRVWLSGPHVEARINEGRLKRLVPGAKREYLPIGFDAAVKRADELPKTRADREEVARRRARTMQFFESLLLGGSSK